MATVEEIQDRWFAAGGLAAFKTFEEASAWVEEGRAGFERDYRPKDRAKALAFYVEVKRAYDTVGTDEALKLVENRTSSKPGSLGVNPKCITRIMGGPTDFNLAAMNRLYGWRYDVPL